MRLVNDNTANAGRTAYTPTEAISEIDATLKMEGILWSFDDLNML